MRILLSGLLLVLPLAAFSKDYQLSECPPPVEEEAECYCNHSYFENEGWLSGFGETYEEAEENAKSMCKYIVRLVLIDEEGYSEAEADQYDYNSHVTNQCRPTSCILRRKRRGLIP